MLTFGKLEYPSVKQRYFVQNDPCNQQLKNISYHFYHFVKVVTNNYTPNKQ